MENKIKFSSQVDSRVLAAIKAIAASEGRQLQAVLNEALGDYLEKKRSGKPRPRVMEAFADSLREFDALYRDLAK